MDQRHTFIHQVKRELDEAANAVARAEGALMARGAGVAAELPGLYGRQDRVGRRLAMISRIHEIGSAESSRDAVYHQLAGYVFRSSDDIDTVPGTRQSLERLAEAVHAYFHHAFDAGNDRRVQTAWQELETAFKGLGRDI